MKVGPDSPYDGPRSARGRKGSMAGVLLDDDKTTDANRPANARTQATPIREVRVWEGGTMGGWGRGECDCRGWGIKDRASWRGNFIPAVAAQDMRPRDIPANINFFMNVPVRQDGSTEIVEGLSAPGDFVDLRADKDVLVVISNCPQLYNPCSGWNPTPVRLIEWRAV